MDDEQLKQKPHRSGFVNIIGRPNAGKSTLMNELVGEQLAIITSKAQTTRHRIFGIVNGEDFQIVYSDTPGIIDPAYKMQEAMMRFVRTSLVDADVLLIIVDATNKVDASSFAERVSKVKVPVLFLLNKIDLLSEREALEKMAAWKEIISAEEYIPISALKKINLQVVFDKIVGKLPIAPPYYPKDALTDKPERFFVSEIIREKILLTYKQEIPYSVEVVIESFKEEEEIVRISALIICNRKTQKPILIGKGGSKLKRVGTLARKDIEKFLNKKVFLQLYVKVRENWRDDDKTLRNWGYE